MLQLISFIFLLSLFIRTINKCMFPCALAMHWLFPSILVYSTLNGSCMVQGFTSVHVAFHRVYYPCSHDSTVLILICATLEIYSKMGPIFITSRHATLALQMISELEFPYRQATSPIAFLMFQSKDCTSFLALISFPICYFLCKGNQTCNILDSRQDPKCWSVNNLDLMLVHKTIICFPVDITLILFNN